MYLLCLGDGPTVLAKWLLSLAISRLSLFTVCSHWTRYEFVPTSLASWLSGHSLTHSKTHVECQSERLTDSIKNPWWSAEKCGNVDKVARITDELWRFLSRLFIFRIAIVQMIFRYAKNSFVCWWWFTYSNDIRWNSFLNLSMDDVDDEALLWNSLPHAETNQSETSSSWRSPSSDTHRLGNSSTGFVLNQKKNKEAERIPEHGKYETYQPWTAMFGPPYSFFLVKIGTEAKLLSAHLPILLTVSWRKWLIREMGEEQGIRGKRRTRREAQKLSRHHLDLPRLD
jgi:hypothetical protein